MVENFLISRELKGIRSISSLRKRKIEDLERGQKTLKIGVGQKLNNW